MHSRKWKWVKWQHINPCISALFIHSPLLTLRKTKRMETLLHDMMVVLFTLSFHWGLAERERESSHKPLLSLRVKFGLWIISGGKLKMNLGPLAESSLSSALIVMNCCKWKTLCEQMAPSLGTPQRQDILRHLAGTEHLETAENSFPQLPQNASTNGCNQKHGADSDLEQAIFICYPI